MYRWLKRGSVFLSPPPRQLTLTKQNFIPKMKRTAPSAAVKVPLNANNHGGGREVKMFCRKNKEPAYQTTATTFFFFFRSAKWFMEIQANRCSPAEQKGYLTDPIALPSRLAVPSYFKCTHTGWSTVRHKKCKECPWKTSRLQLVHKGSPCANRAREFLSRSWPGIRWGD